MKCKYPVKILFPSIALTLLPFLCSKPTLANDPADVATLRQELLELEQFTKPFLQTFRKISQLVSPSVVSLSTEKKGDPKETADPPPPYQQFPPGRDPHMGDMPKKGLGSGIIVDEQGHILTNNHVIDGFSEDEITVITYDQEQHTNIKIVGVDPNTDLAVIKIEPDNLLPVKFGNSDEVQVGDWVIAIGSPFGYHQTVSAGIISAKGRTHVIPFVLPFIYEDFFQTDAAINPGNSGGPLVNLRGEVIGINTAIATRSGGSQGIGFAISATIAKETAETLITTGTAIRGYLGVGTHDINDELAILLGLRNKKEIISYMGLPKEKGAFVVEVWQDTPASKAGILPGDIIFELGEKKIETTTDLQHAIRRAKVGSVISLKVIRNGLENTLNVTVEQQPGNLAGKTYTTIQKLEEPCKLSFGLMVNNLNPEIAKSLGLENEKGILVVEVEAGSQAEHAGIKPGDLITKVGTKEVSSVMEFIELIEGFLKEKGTVSVYIKGKGFITLIFMKE
ncbi:MAG: trypsin-like peptidase domain-containing protein [Candidatus Loosdrechtia sp.]|uniref:trypsin-like peptidase domain-containing protein n=1 Tax=Candidatus Loosdrechtia sp. TaxID=3101272 RepID=UPI003A5D3518|nr:MAG: trypsin-like peptidase domain-containing protein [Candidatus Jettenia sp. AMX2]